MGPGKGPQAGGPMQATELGESQSDKDETFSSPESTTKSLTFTPRVDKPNFGTKSGGGRGDLVKWTGGLCSLSDFPT